MKHIKPITNNKEYDEVVFYLEHFQPKTTEEKENWEVHAQLADNWIRQMEERESNKEIDNREMLREILYQEMMTQSEFAKKLGVPQSYVSQMLRGSKPINEDHIKRICKIFDLTRDFFGPAPEPRFNVLRKSFSSSQFKRNGTSQMIGIHTKPYRKYRFSEKREKDAHKVDQ